MQQNFDFVRDHRYKKILVRDYIEMKSCLDSGAYKSVLVMAGSIIESLLLEFLVNSPPEGYTVKKINNLKFVDLIEIAESSGLISHTTKDLSSVIREYRNFVHPSKEIRSITQINEDKAMIASRLVNLVIQNVQAHYPKLYGNKAEDVFTKLRSDAHSRKILMHLLDKMNQAEIDLLYEKFMDYYIDSDEASYQLRQFVYFGKDNLDDKVSDKVKLKYAMRVEFEIINGSTDCAIRLFELFGDKVGLYDFNTLDSILTYVYSSMGTCGGHEVNPRLYNYATNGIIDHLNIYLNPKSAHYSTHLGVIESIIRNIVRFEEDEDRYDLRQAYKSLAKGLPQNEYDAFTARKSLQRHMIEFNIILNDKDLLPF